MFLALDLLLGRLRHHLKSVDYFKLLQMNLEQQCMVRFYFHLSYGCSAVLLLTFDITETLSFAGY